MPRGWEKDKIWNITPYVFWQRWLWGDLWPLHAGNFLSCPWRCLLRTPALWKPSVPCVFLASTTWCPGRDSMPWRDPAASCHFGTVSVGCCSETRATAAATLPWVGSGCTGGGQLTWTKANGCQAQITLCVVRFRQKSKEEESWELCFWREEQTAQHQEIGKEAENNE